MTDGEMLVRWTARMALALYALAMACWLGGRQRPESGAGPRTFGAAGLPESGLPESGAAGQAGMPAPRQEWLAGLAWTAGCGFCLVHVASGFHFYHHWSHAAAYREIARQTAETMGLAYGAGIYFNYAFALAWVADVLYWWQGPQRHSRPARALRAALHVFLAFIVFNAAVVFKTGLLRWLGLATTVFLLALWRRNPRAIENLLTSARPR